MNTAVADKTIETFFSRELELYAVIAVDSTNALPAIGGCRCLHYSNRADVQTEALRLSKAMTEKAKAHNLQHGGAKMVVSLPNSFDRTLVMQQIGKWVDSLEGAYITASDSGTNSNDMDLIYKTTQHVACPQKWQSYNPSYYTALGVYHALTASIGALDNKAFTIQGLGEVGMHLLAMLSEHDTKIFVSDTDVKKTKMAAERYDVELLSPNNCISNPCDVFVPCALGAILNPISLPKLGAKLVVGAANNQFLDPIADKALAAQLGITVVPDIIANGGGLIHVAGLYSNKTDAQIRADVAKIHERVRTYLRAKAC